MTFTVSLSDQAAKFYRDAEPSLRRKLDRCFQQLSVTPQQHPQIKRLKGQFAQYWRYRVADYRVVFRIEAAAEKVIVVAIAHRRDVYEK